MLKKFRSINFKKIDYRNYIMISLVLLSLGLAIFYFKYADNRLWETLIDIKNSFKYYISELFILDWETKITINDFTKQPFEMPFNLPSTLEELKAWLKEYWNEFKQFENVKLYFTYLSILLQKLLRYIILIMPFILIFYLIMEMFGHEVNNDYNKDSKALIFWKKVIEDKILIPIKNWIIKFLQFNKEHSYYIKLIILIWCYSFNIYSIFIEAVAYYLYFVMAFDLSTIYIQFLKLLFDLSIMLDFVPLFIWLIVTMAILNAWRRKIGYLRLNHFEAKNKGFINERSLCTLNVGTMGKGKTKLMTDINLSIESMFRNKAYELILECDLKFPNFPWINLENAMKKAISKHNVYNLATTKKFIDMLETQFYLSYSEDVKSFKSIRRKIKKYYGTPVYENSLFDYDLNRYPLDYDNKLFIKELWEVIKDYAQLYFIYIVESSLILSNYSIRTDNQLQDLGNFPLWNTDFFKKDSRLLEAHSRHSHILDYDSLRLGKLIINNNKKANSLEFGVISTTELGKERGNMLELQHIKRNEDTTNQKNDLFNHSIKMARHKATIMNYPFIRFTGDDQRPESLGADARDLFEIVHIDEVNEMELAMPLFSLEYLICNFIINKFKDSYSNYRFERGDNTLLMYLFHNLTAKVNKYYEGVINTFGYQKYNLKLEAGTQDGIFKDKEYYLSFKKIYSLRYSTDCFSDFFDEKAYKSTIGINDLQEYRTERASFDEMELQNSYFFNELKKLK